MILSFCALGVCLKSLQNMLICIVLFMNCVPCLMEPPQWFENLHTTIQSNVYSTRREKSAMPLLQQLYEDDRMWDAVAINSSSTLSTARNKVQNLTSSAEQVVETLAKNAEYFNKNSRRDEESKRIKPELTNKTVRFYNKPPVQNASAIEENNVNSADTLFYYNSKCKCGYQLPNYVDESQCYDPENFFPDLRYGNRNVSFNLSAVHIPVDVYNEGREVLRDILWSHNMDRNFSSLHCNNSQVRWSYVATLSGVVRYYPAAPWDLLCTDGKRIDLFDGRSNGWFVQSMTSRKNLLIMIDASGSIVGLTLNLVRVSVDHVLQSLTRDDYFNVIVFDKTSAYLNPSCSGMLPASHVYKEMLMQWLDNITVENPASFENAFNFTFGVFNFTGRLDFDEKIRIGCNPVILLFTDGGEPYPENALNKWNDDQHTRIFTYSVGKHFASTAELKEIACKNKGTFSTIPSDSATHFQTMEYLVTLSRPLVFFKEESKSNKWTLPYEDHLGLGTVLTVSRPFYEDYTVNEEGRNTHKHVKRVAGIAGADILYKDLERALRVSNGSSTAYMFGTENNGYLIYHPLLQKGRLNSPVMVDVMDLEIANVAEVRKAMINQDANAENAPVILEKSIPSFDKEHVTKSNFSYFHIPLSRSSFSIGLAFPTSNQYWISPNDEVTFSWRDISIDDDNVFTSAYGVECEVADNKSQKMQCSAADKFNRSINEPSVNIRSLELNNETKAREICGDSAFDSLMGSKSFLFHGRRSRELMTQWNPPTNGVLANFVASDSKPALLRIRYNIDTTQNQTVTALLADPMRKDYFLRPLLDSNPIQFYSVVIAKQEYTLEVPSTPSTAETTDFDTSSNTYESTTSTVPISNYLEDTDNFFVITSGAVSVTREKQVLRPAVVGAVLQYNWVRETFLKNAEDKCSGESEECESKNCKNEAEELCMILDDGGLLLFSNQRDHREHIGKFYGYLDWELMMALKRDSLFVSSNISDHQVVCTKSDDGDSAARSNFVVPSLMTILKSGWWFTSSLLIAFQTFVSLVLTTLQEVTSQSFTFAFNRDEFLYPNYNSKKVHCVVQKTIFSFGENASSKGMTSVCNRTYTADRIENTNLLFVVAATAPEQQCSVPYKESDRYSVVTYAGDCPSERYRRPPQNECFDAYRASNNNINDGPENYSCGTCHFIPSIFLVFLLVFIQLLSSFLR